MLTKDRIACKLCGSSELLAAYEEQWRGDNYAGFYCAKCDVYQTLGNVADVSPQYHSLTDDEIKDQYVFQSSFAHKGGAFRQWRKLMIAEGGPIQGDILDIGCGIGGFLNYASEIGLKCHGFDAAEPQVAYARRSHSDIIQATTLDEYLSKLNRKIDFNYLTMWDVLEHIPDPIPMLTSLKKAMAPESLLYIAVPSGGTIPMKRVYYKATGAELSLAPWEHVFYYTPKSLRDVLERVGLNVLDVGGVAVYERPMGVREAVRRVVTKGLNHTRYAMQLYAVAKLS